MHYHIAIYACMYIKLYNGAAECVHRETKNVILGVGYAKNKTFPACDADKHTRTRPSKNKNVDAFLPLRHMKPKNTKTNLCKWSVLT